MKTNNKTSKSKAKISTVQEGNKEQLDDVLRRERTKKLQRKKDAPKVDRKTEEFIVDIINGRKWERNHLDNYSEEEHQIYLNFLEGAFSLLGFNDRDRFLNRIENVLTEASKNNIWEFEHVAIENAIDTLARDKNRLAARIEVSDKTCLNQETIKKHKGEYFQSHHHTQRQQEFLLMKERLLSHCYKFAINGDMKSTRLFFEATSEKRPETSIKNQQNNFVQINNLTITEEQIINCLKTNRSR